MSNTVRSGGISFSGLLTIVLIVLKLGEIIDWSWIWVLAPLWIPVAGVAAVGIIAGVVFLIVLLIAWVKDRG